MASNDRDERARSGPGVVLRDLAYRYPDASRDALAGVTAELSGGAIAVLGQEGAGKTTLVRLLSASARASGGGLAVGGLSPEDPAAYRAGLGIVAQGLQLSSDYTCAAYLRHVCRLREVPVAGTETAVREALWAVDLAPRADMPVKRLSPDLVRRLGLAQAVVGRPRLVLLDEPTTGLDPRQRAAFREHLAELGESATVVLATRLVEDVAAVAREVLVLDGGRQVFAGPLREMCRVPGESPVTAADVELAYLRMLPS